MNNILFKKFLAGIWIFSLMVLNFWFFISDAANIRTVNVNWWSTLAANAIVTTISFTPSTALTNGSTIVIGYPTNFTDTSLVIWDISVANAARNLVAGTIVLDTTANTITIPVTTAGTAWSIVTITFANSHLVAPASWITTFTVSTSKWDSGASIITIALANQVAVSATVLPILTLTVDSNSLSFWTLDQTVKTAQSSIPHRYIQVWIATNSNGWAIVTLRSTNNGRLLDWWKTINASTVALTPGVSWVSYETASKSWNSSIADSTILDLTSWSAAILNTNGWISANQTVNIVAKATTSITQAAGNYSDTLTFTATWTF